MADEKHIHIHIHLDGLLEDERVVPVPTQKKRPASRSNGKPTAKVVRAWALEHGVPVSKTGKIAQETFDAYAASQR